MKTIITIIAFFGFYSSEAQTGSLSGNVYYKYNEFVGNRADAGARILVLNYSDSNFSTETTADLQGNYKVENLKNGKYFVIIKSKGTNQSPAMTATALKTYKNVFKNWPYIYRGLYENPLYNDLEDASIEYTKYTMSEKPNSRKLATMETNVINKMYAYWGVLPFEIQFRINSLNPNDKIVYEDVTIENNNKALVTDFGTSDH